MNTAIKSISILALVASSGLALAEHENEDNTYLDAANVVSVEPIIRTVVVTVPQRECYTEEVRTPVYQGGGDNGGSTVVGGVVGGILGNKLSHGRGVATIAGTIIGAAIGNEVGRANATPPSYREDVSYQDRCTVRQVAHNEERTEGYRVTYRYKGETFTTRLPYDPGKQLRIRVNVTPII
ncbi:MAG: glycine zipper 2TM domain-containing protein [Gammaproteobacteria bacterium]|nr:glycine zipper 2TM domain-containing protein [Gammaproteobacteria bacterium]